MKTASKNVGSFLAFNKEWFEKHQAGLVWLLNNRITKRWFRWVLRIHKQDIGCNGWIVKIEPHAYTVFRGTQNGEYLYTTDFRTHPKYGKRLYFAFKPLWWMVHFWDWALADRFVPQWSYGFATLTAYPDTNPETATVDGIVGNDDSPYATAHDALTGSSASDSTTSGNLYRQRNNAGTYFIDRGIFLFDTSSIPDAATISATTISFMCNLRGDPDADSLSIVTSNPASNTAVAAADFDQVGNAITSPTKQASDTLASGIDVSGTVYTNISLNATGIGNVSKTGISKFGTRSAQDCSKTAPSGNNFLVAYFADEAGTTKDPKLVVTYTASTAYTITAAQGSYALSGRNSLFHFGRKIIAAFRSFALSGQELDLWSARYLNAVKGNFTLTGFNALLAKGKTLVAAVGTFTVTGYSATITSVRTMIAALGSYTLTGQTALFSVGRTLVASVGSFTHTGIGAVLSFGRRMVAAYGSFTLTGQNATFPIARILTAAHGVISISWQSIRVLLNGLVQIYSDKYSRRNTSYSDNYSARGTTYEDKYSHLE